MNFIDIIRLLQFPITIVTVNEYLTLQWSFTLNNVSNCQSIKLYNFSTSNQRSKTQKSIIFKIDSIHLHLLKGNQKKIHYDIISTYPDYHSR